MQVSEVVDLLLVRRLKGSFDVYEHMMVKSDSLHQSQLYFSSFGGNRVSFIESCGVLQSLACRQIGMGKVLEESKKSERCYEVRTIPIVTRVGKACTA